jgi:HK97 gp10 family phage protein
VGIKRDGLIGNAFIGPAGKMYYPDRGTKEKGTATGKNPKKGGLVPVASVARFLEFGTSKMAAKPFMRPSFKQSAQDALDSLIESLRDALAEL